MSRATPIDVPQASETFDLAADRPRCDAAAAALLAQLMLPRRWARWLRRRYADPTFAYHGAAHVGLLWLRHLAHGGAADDLGTALAIMFHDAVYQPGAADNETRSAALLREAAGHRAEAGWAAAAILATADHLAYADADLRVLRLLDLDLTPLAEHPAIFAHNAATLRTEAARIPEPEWKAMQRRFFARMLKRAPLFRSGLGCIYEAPARRNLGAASQPSVAHSRNVPET